MTPAIATQHPAQTAARSHLPWILGLAVAVRAAVAGVFFYANHAVALNEWGYENLSIALSLHAGHGYSSPFLVPSGPTAFMAPGYPLLLAGFIWLLGTGAEATVAIIVFQILLSLITVVLVQKVTSRYFGMQSGNLAALVCALAEPLLFAPLFIWDTCLSALILVLAIAFAPAVRTRGDFAIAGLACAVAALINPSLLPTLLAIGTWSAWRVRIFPWLGLLCFFVAFSPWPIRNYVTMHAFIPFRSNTGFELWAGNRPGSRGESDLYDRPTFDPNERRLFLAEGELRYMHEKGNEAKAWIQAHPREFARFTAWRIVRFWIGSSQSPGPMTVALAALGIIGVALLWRTRQMFILFALPLVIYPLPYYITHSDVRYQFVIDPLLAVLAGFVCESFFAWCSRRPSPSPTLAN